MAFLSVLNYAHKLMTDHINPGDTVIDATVGNGFDTLFLMERVGLSGCVYGFDIQQQALEITSEKIVKKFAGQAVPDNTTGETGFSARVIPDNTIEETGFAKGAADNRTGEPVFVERIIPHNRTEETEFAKQVIPDNTTEKIGFVKQVVPDSRTGEPEFVEWIIPDNSTEETTLVDSKAAGRSSVGDEQSTFADDTGTLSRPPSVQLLHQSHADMLQFIPVQAHDQVAAIMFNLGYCPGQDHRIVTQPDSTTAALNASAKLLKRGGILTIIVYTGHEGGPEEAEAVLYWSTQLPPGDYNVFKYYFINQINHPSFLVAVEKR